MNNNTSTFLKKNAVTIVILIATLILAGIAVFTAIRLYQLRSQPVALNAPASTPAAQDDDDNDQQQSQCKLAFTINLATPTASASSSPTSAPSASPTAKATATPTATPTEPPTGGTSPTPSSTPASSSTATPVSQVSPTSTPVGLPDAGVALPTLLGIMAGILLLGSAVLIAL